MGTIGSNEAKIRNVIKEISSKATTLSSDIKDKYGKVLDNVVTGWHSNPGNEGEKRIHAAVNDMLEVVAKNSNSICKTIQDAANAIEITINDGNRSTWASSTFYGEGAKFYDVKEADMTTSVLTVDLDSSRLYKSGDDFYIIKDIIEDVIEVIPTYEKGVLDSVSEMKSIFSTLSQVAFLTDNASINEDCVDLFNGLQKTLNECLTEIDTVISDILRETRLSYDKALKVGEEKLKSVSYHKLSKNW